MDEELGGLLRVPYFPDPDCTFKTTYTKRLKNGNMVWIIQLISNKKTF